MNNHPITRHTSIFNLVKDLPEVYQPIFGHPELSIPASRSCDDRSAVVINVHDALNEVLKRSLRVLDLGCAQGFFSHHLCARGATVHGIDYADANVALCKALASENPSHRATFEIARIEDALADLHDGEFDLVPRHRGFDSLTSG